jgi:CDP-paratose 2-epimerase
MKIIVTGGSGFIGVNAAARYIRRGDEVVIIDNLARRGADSNLAWLRRLGNFELAQIDIADADAVDKAIGAHAQCDLILHLAGQVAVTTSVAEPRRDFEVNALGTINVLEAMRRHRSAAVIIYASTNKVYGNLSALEVSETATRYSFSQRPLGVSEDEPLDFHSPYGCSKGSADQYVRDYHRIYGINSVVMRQSCIYGTRQFGVEDQGWIAWITIAAELGAPITLYGDGKQVRDVLYVDDLLDAYDGAAKNIVRTRGQIYNLGGGPGQAISLLDLVSHLSELRDKQIDYARAGWRPGDQRVYVSDVRLAARDFGWAPKTGWKEGVRRLREWVIENRAELEAALRSPA